MGNFIQNNDGLSVTYDDIPNGLVPDFKGVIYYFQTSFAKSTKEHNEAIEPIIEKVLSENDTHYTSWEVVKRETLVYTQISQVTVVSFRVRDAW